MTPYERADIVVRHIYQEGLAVILDADESRVRALVAAAIRAAVEEERALAQSRFHYNAQLPSTWEHDAISAAVEAEREACALVVDGMTDEYGLEPVAIAIRARGEL